MEKIGSMDMKFNRVDGDVYYYDVLIQVGSEKRKITFPRYNIMLGWIEIFGFPPQQEWVVLADIEPFIKTAFLTINGENVEEEVNFNTNKKEGFHKIVTTRKFKKLTEIFTWTEDYNKGPVLILNIGSFEHDEGVYRYDVKKELITDPKNLITSHGEFYASTVNKHGKPDVIWKKTFTAGGTPPKLFYKMFPIQEILDLSEVHGSIVEFGYLEKEGKAVDRTHGKWYKFIEINNQNFCVKEENYSSLTIKVGEKEQVVKATYSEKLYKI